ncbi:hypothetical protein [Streptomyces daliensis]
MTHNAPLSPRPLSELTDAVRQRVLTARALREHGVTTAVANERCRPGGPWQMPLPGVYVLHAGPPTSDERLRAVLLYAGRQLIPPQPRPEDGHDGGDGGAEESLPRGCVVMITGLAALALHGFSSAPPLRSLDQLDVLVPRTRRLRSHGCARVVRDEQPPEPEQVTGLPVAPVPRALADAVLRLTDAVTVRRLLTEAVRGGHCEAQAVVRELTRARLLASPHVVDAVDALLAEGRALAEGSLYAMVRCHDLPDPCWNVDLRLPGGPHLGGVDAFWPDHGVALELDTRAPRHQQSGAQWSSLARKRQALEEIGVAVVHLTPKRLRESLESQAAIVRTALVTSAERAPAEYVVVSPR